MQNVFSSAPNRHAKATKFFKMEYYIERRGSFKYIVASENKEPEWYDISLIKNPCKIPREKEEWLITSPHIALARVDAKDENSILEFVNQWGLLNLWNVMEYKKQPELLMPDTSRNLGFGNDFSGEFINKNYYRKRKRNLHKYQEPVWLFADAAEEFQNMYKLLYSGTEEEQIIGSHNLNHFIQDCKPNIYFNFENKKLESFWQTNSLLHYCYLLTYIDLSDDVQLKRCKYENCSKYFIPIGHQKNKQIYCSINCQKTAKRIRNYERKKSYLAI